MEAGEHGGAILVTGSRGFIGRSLARLLTFAGCRVVGFDRAAPQAGESGSFMRGDVEDPHRLHEALRREDVSQIVHLAGLSGPMLSRDDPHYMMRVNIGGTSNVLEAARVAGVDRIVFLSSIMAYGPQPTDGTIGEDHPLDASDAYGASKIAGEAMMRAYSREHGLDAVSLRVSSVFGRGRQTDCVISRMIADGLAEKPTHLPFGNGRHRQYLHVEDAAAAIRQVLTRRRLPRSAYNITGGTRVTLDRVAEIVRRLLPKADISLGDAPHPFDYPIGTLDISAARRDFGYTPELSLEEGLRRHVTDARQSA